MSSPEPGQPRRPAGPTSTSVATTMSSIGEQLHEMQHRLMAMVADLDDGRRDDVVRALYETERLLRSAGRSLRRARQSL